MGLILGSNDGVWEVDGGAARRLGLEGKRIVHVAQRDGAVLGAVAGDGVYALDGGGSRRVWEGDAHSCAIGPDGAWYAGAEPAMIFRSRNRGAGWTRLASIGELPTRGEWTFPPPPHEPHVLSIDSLPGRDGTVLAGIEVGGVIISEDGGDTWRELNEGIYVDVHSTRPHPGDGERLFAVTGAGFYASEDGGQHWRRRMEGIGAGYTIGLAVGASGGLIVTVTDGPQGANGRVFASRDGGCAWEQIAAEQFPDPPRRAAVPFFTGDTPWLGCYDGRLLRGGARWELVTSLAGPINTIASAGVTSSVMH
jgi:photosystem II stability/assembly factor-like uncharacterized protein